MTAIGSKFGSLTILDVIREKGIKVALCRCDCGVEKKVRFQRVTAGATVSCGCIRRKHSVLVGEKYGRLTVLSLDYKIVKDHLKVPVLCDCGTRKLVGVSEMATGKTKSCGCIGVEMLVDMSRTHGGDKTPLYSVWHTMKNRCLNPSTDSFENYGGRGIKICAEWMEDFAAFRSWAEGSGYKAGLQIDREAVNGNYEPGNCRWVTPKVQGNNRRNNVLLTAFGETKTMSQWADDPRCAVGYTTLKERVGRQAWPHAAAISEPPLIKRHNKKPA